MNRIHIVASGPRTGTTLLMEMMVAGFAIDSYPDHEASLFRSPPRGAQTFLTKAPNEGPLAERALEVMPELLIIYVLRDPRDMVVSKHHSDLERYWAGLNFWKHLSPVARRLRSHPRCITVSFEDLVKDPDAIQQRFRSRMPFLVQTSCFRDYTRSAKPSAAALRALGGLRLVSGDNVGNWRRHLPRVAGQIELHGSITPDLLEFGFENDPQWEKVLDGVTRDLRPSHWPDEWALDKICPQPPGGWRFPSRRVSGVTLGAHV
jgi:hypothetical protein